jgi:hypothetical protein
MRVKTVFLKKLLFKSLFTFPPKYIYLQFNIFFKGEKVKKNHTSAYGGTHNK